MFGMNLAEGLIISIMETTEADLLQECSQCYLLLEQYKLRTNLVGANVQKQLLENSYLYLHDRVTERYSQLFQQLKEAIGRLEITFRIAQANALRTLNNIIRNYRRRVGTLANEPLSSLKYGRFERQEKLLLESLVYLQRENLSEIGGFREQLEKTIAAASHQIEQKYRRNPKIREDYRTVFDIIDRSQCYTYRYYQGFERGLLSSVNNLDAQFDKLNAFLSVWQNVGSTKAYESRSAKEMENEEKTQEGVGRRFHQEESQEQLEELMRGCPQHSPQRQEYRKRLNDLRRYNSEKQKKLDQVGKMYGKRRNRAGILVSRSKEVSLLELVINSDNSKIPSSYQDPFRHYKPDSEHADYRPTPYETYRPLKTAEEAREYLDKHRVPPPNQEWWYDRFGKEGTLDLIASQSQMVQKRIEFEVIRQTQLQNADDRRKRQLLQKQNYQTKENQRREGLHVGFKHIHDKTELELLMIRAYNSQYIPSLAQHPDISFSDDDHSSSQEGEQPQPLFSVPSKLPPKRAHPKQDIPLIKMEAQKPIPILPEPAANPQPEKTEAVGEEVNVEMPLQQQIIMTYFHQYSRKIIRKEEEPEYKKTQFLYFSSIPSIDWSLLESAYAQCEKIFIFTPRSIFYFNKILSAQQEKMKCSVYTLQQDGEEEEKGQKEIKTAVQKCFRNLALVTVRFHPLYFDSPDTTAFMMGLLMVLLREGKMEEDAEIKDYINEGKEIIDDFNQYYYPTEEKNTKSLYMRKFMPRPPQELFAPKKQENTPPSRPNSNTIQPQQQPQAFPMKQTTKTHQPMLGLPKKEAPASISESEPPLSQPEAIPAQLQDLHSQRELPRSNSREYLGKFQLQLQLAGGQQGGESGQEDYEQL